jgi:ferredoxin
LVIFRCGGGRVGFVSAWWEGVAALTDEKVAVNLEIDREVCIGSGQCVLQMPELFDQSEDDGRVLLRHQPQAEDAPAVEDAVLLCPSGALRTADR